MPSKTKTAEPMSDEAIRHRAYLMWEADGRPDGKADHYWMRAAAPDAAVADDVAETARKVRKAIDAPETTKPGKTAKTAAKPSKAAAKPAAKAKSAASKVSAPAVKAKAASKPPSKKKD